MPSIAKTKWSLPTLFAIAALALNTSNAEAKKIVSPDILVLGDSQLSFGSGPEFLKFFKDIKTQCGAEGNNAQYLDQLGDMTVGILGVRSTSLHAWTARKGRSKALICKVDRKWKVNASTFGTFYNSKTRYVQIGKGANYQFCKKGKSAFEAMFAKDQYAPKLLVMHFLGNSASRWAKSKKTALRDVTATMKQLPKDLPCIFMTTAPPYKKKTVKLRLKAQANLKYAFMKNGSRCSFVEGHSTRTVASNQGNKKYFRRKKSGAVKDPYHPNKRAAKKFLSTEMKDICMAVFDQLGPLPVSTSWRMRFQTTPPADVKIQTTNCDSRCSRPALKEGAAQAILPVK